MRGRDEPPLKWQALELAERSRALSGAGQDGREGYIGRVSVACEQVPNPDSRVTLDEEKDALGMPRARLAWRLTGDDFERVRAGFLVLARALGEAGAGRLSFDFGEHPFRQGRGSEHHMGTTRMHPDPRQGVVDADCKVHGVDNLYVAGSSVFPTCGSSNPTLTIAALAIRLADHLRARL
jgi:choline dehydrogenase-like flavoprotein